MRIFRTDSISVCRWRVKFIKCRAKSSNRMGWALKSTITTWDSGNIKINAFFRKLLFPYFSSTLDGVVEINKLLFCSRGEKLKPQRTIATKHAKSRDGFQFQAGNYSTSFVVSWKRERETVLLGRFLGGCTMGSLRICRILSLELVERKSGKWPIYLKEKKKRYQCLTYTYVVSFTLYCFLLKKYTILN